MVASSGRVLTVMLSSLFRINLCCLSMQNWKLCKSLFATGGGGTVGALFCGMGLVGTIFRILVCVGLLRRHWNANKLRECVLLTFWLKLFLSGTNKKLGSFYLRKILSAIRKIYSNLKTSKYWRWKLSHRSLFFVKSSCLQVSLLIFC